MKQAAFKRTDKQIDQKAAESFVNNSSLDQSIKDEEKKINKKISSVKENISIENNKEEIDREAKKEFLLRMPSDLHKKLKMKSVEEDINMGDLILEAIEKVYFPQ